MKIGARFTSRALFVAAFLLLIATNAFVLYSVAANRSDPAEARLVLSERELGLPAWVHDEDSGLALRLAWRALPSDDEYSQYTNWRSPGWFDRRKLVALGFEMDPPHDDDEKGGAHYKRAVSKEVYIVLELDGPSYKEMLRRAELAVDAAAALYAEDNMDEERLKKLEHAEADLERERREKTRLFAIDAALDPQALRSKYGERGRFIIARGRVKPVYTYAQWGLAQAVMGTIERLSVEKIHVPGDMRAFFEALPAAVDEGVGAQAPRYQVELAYGSRHEPWIVSVSPNADPSPASHENENRQRGEDDGDDA
jgi:hypothetical protein